MNWLKRIPLPWLAYGIVLLPMVYSALRAILDLPPAGTHLFGSSDPDPWLRLTLVREWLSGGSWYSHIVTHSGAPTDVITSPWTRPLDLVIAAFTSLQPHHLSLSDRLLHSALLLPIVWMSLFLFGLMRAVRHITTAPLAPLMTAVMLCLAPMMGNYFGTANADHHGMLAAVFACTLATLFTPSPSPRTLIATGALFGLLLWISPETMPIIAAAYGWYGLRWLMGEAVAMRQLRTLSTATILTAILALVVERPSAEWLTPVYDSLSAPLLFPLLLSALAASMLSLFPASRFASRLMLGVATSLIVLGGTYLVYPLMFAGSSAFADAYVVTTFLPSISEMHSVFDPSNSTAFIAAMLLQPMAVLVFLLLSLRNAPSLPQRTHALTLLYFLAITGALFLLHIRFYYYCYPFLVLALAPMLTALLEPDHPSLAGRWPARWLAPLNENAQATRRLPLLLILLGAPIALGFAAPDTSTPRGRNMAACEATAMRMLQRGDVAALLGDSPLTLFTSTNLGAHVLFFTPYRIIASNYHREGAGIRYLWEAEAIGSPAALRPYLAKRGVQALLLCPTAFGTENDVLNRLQQGALTLSWLKRLPYTPPPLTRDEQKQREKDGITHADPAIFLLR